MCKQSRSSLGDHVKTKPSPKKRKQSITKVSSKPSRKSRTKTRKPKFLSLKLALSSKDPTLMTQQNDQRRRHQLNLFPLHPDNLLHDSKDDDTTVAAAFLFDSASDTATTLHGLLDCSTTTATTGSEDDPLSPPSMSYEGYRDGLVRTAMRCKDRDVTEEKWVSYSEVVERIMVKEEEVSSVDADPWVEMRMQQGLALKLDYDKIMNAWSDKGPLYVSGECPQVVPDLHDHATNEQMVGNLWRVPEMGGKSEELKRGQREASVLRYKEKRQSRLFSKRIRYEVRKLNAQKRPRMKGRFVRRNIEE